MEQFENARTHDNLWNAAQVNILAHQVVMTTEYTQSASDGPGG